MKKEKTIDMSQYQYYPEDKTVLDLGFITTGVFVKWWARKTGKNRKLISGVLKGRS